MNTSSLPASSSRATADKQRRLARYRRTLQLCEPLEPRQLLSVSTISYSIQDVTPYLETYDSSGNLWVVNSSVATGNTLLQEISNQQVVDTIDVSNYSPNAIAAGPANHIYMADSNNGIDDVDLSAGTVTPYYFSQYVAPPDHITVSGNGDVWFIPQSANSDYNDNSTNIVGRWTPGASDPDYFTLPSSTSDSYSQAIAPAGNDSVWVGLTANDDGVVFGTDHLALVSYDGSYAASVYSITSGNAISDAHDRVSSLASDGSGGVWISLSSSVNPISINTTYGPDMLVHASFSGTTLNQSGVEVPGYSSSTPLNVTSLSRDAAGHIWFVEDNTGAVGCFDPSITPPSSAFSFQTVPASSDYLAPFEITASPVAAEATTYAVDVVDSSQPAIFLQIDVQSTVTFSGSASNLSGQEGTTFNNQLLATFTAPDLASGNYSATITWGDGTTSTVTATPLGDNLYGVVINGKSFATQGTYNGSIAITDPNNNAVGTLSFQSLISDTPLNVTSFTGVNIFAGITAAAGSFTDDAGLPTSTWTATINWGDGTTSSAIIVKDPTQAGRYLIIGLHVYRKAGTYTLSLLVNTNEPDAAITNDTLTASVTVR